MKKNIMNLVKTILQTIRYLKMVKKTKEMLRDMAKQKEVTMRFGLGQIYQKLKESYGAELVFRIHLANIKFLLAHLKSLPYYQKQKDNIYI